MSDVVIVAIITASGGIVAAAIGLFKKSQAAERKELKVPEPHTAAVKPEVIVGPARNDEVVLTPRAGAAKGLEATKAESLGRDGTESTMTAEQMRNAIKSAPPLQRDSIERSFIGVRVIWTGKLSSAYRLGDKVRITLSIGSMLSDVRARCEAVPSDCHDLLAAPEGTVVTVRGTITDASSGSAELGNCTFKVP